MFRLRFWALLLSLSALVIGAGEARFALYRARELRLNPPIVSLPHPAMEMERIAPSRADGRATRRAVYRARKGL